MHNKRWNCRSPLLLAMLMFFAPTVTAQGTASWTLKASEWSRPRNAAAVIAMQPVAEAVRAWQAAASQDDHRSRLQLLHSSGEEGGLWAAELRDWLIALGVPATAIEMTPAGLPAERLELRVLATGNLR